MKKFSAIILMFSVCRSFAQDIRPTYFLMDSSQTKNWKTFDDAPYRYYQLTSPRLKNGGQLVCSFNVNDKGFKIPTGNLIKYPLASTELLLIVAEESIRYNNYNRSSIYLILAEGNSLVLHKVKVQNTDRGVDNPGVLVQPPAAIKQKSK